MQHALCHVKFESDSNTCVLTYGSSSQTWAAQRQSIQQRGQHSRLGREHQLPGRLAVIGDAAQHSCCRCHVPHHIAGQTLGCDLQASAQAQVTFARHMQWRMKHNADRSQEPPVMPRLLVVLVP